MASFQQKSVSVREIEENSAFGWVRTRDQVSPEDRAANLDVVMKRKLEFAYDPTISAAEKEYNEIKNKVFKPKKVLLAIFTILCILTLLVTIVELAIGIKNGVDITKANKANPPAQENTEEEAQNAFFAQGFESHIHIYMEGEEEESSSEVVDEENNQGGGFSINTIFEKVGEYNEKIFGFALKLFRDKTDGEGNVTEEGIATKLGNMIGNASVKPFISAEIFVGLIFLILFIIFAIVAGSCNKYKKKNRKINDRKEVLLDIGRDRVKEMKKANPYLMNRSERSMHILSTSIARGIITAENYEDGE
ncbi:MAG: hypothetical protein K5765_05845 [Clostridia bacterium]|nr:hypothetical protein [Clostridia bacterium]